MAEDHGPGRLDMLLVERLKLTTEQAIKTGKMPTDEASTSGACEVQRPVILDADRLSISPVSHDTDSFSEFVEDSIFQGCPSDALLKIFENLTLRERVKLSLTCRRFNEILTNKKVSSIGGLTVLNMFQRKVWQISMDKSPKRSPSPLLTLFKMSKLDHLRSLLRHVKRIQCLKIWYQDREFVDAVLDVFDESVIVRNVDVYPYGDNIALDKVAETFPKLNAITMRPHGAENFFKGLPLYSMPNFAHITTLSIESFEPQPGFEFPSSLRCIDFAHRKLLQKAYFFEALKQLNLRYLAISHLNFTAEQLIAFIEAVSVSTRLEALIMKFCHLDVEISKETRDTDITLRLRQLDFDLCYNVSLSVLKYLVKLSRRTLKSLSMSILYEDEAQFMNLLAMTPTLAFLRAGLHFSVMQKDDEKYKTVKQPPALPEELRHVVTRFEAPYLLKSDLLTSIFGKLCRNLQECKFVATRGINDAVLELIAMNCPILKKLSIISCSETTDEGLLAFPAHIALRKTTEPLNILYKNNGSIVRVYGELAYRSTRHHTINYHTKTFPDSKLNAGECLFFKDTKLDRTVVMKNYTPEDSNFILGLLIDIEEEIGLGEGASVSLDAPIPIPFC